MTRVMIIQYQFPTENRNTKDMASHITRVMIIEYQFPIENRNTEDMASHISQVSAGVTSDYG
jgi:hypothetical protein